ncbi:hypothetical protein A0H81_07869 [Grifola frondosa]|uniref:Uncharacterized protein n=1 Tax=Grifola frondosa TaxID=5627 RepID=A0A1C7M592_GRIFR|nr:hypothetical protein A0H81_07869 [Grifola frondosa]
MPLAGRPAFSHLSGYRRFRPRRVLFTTCAHINFRPMIPLQRCEDPSTTSDDHLICISKRSPIQQARRSTSAVDGDRV